MNRYICVRAQIIKRSYVVIMALNHFIKERGPIFNGFCEDLEQVAIIIVINQNVQFLECKTIGDFSLQRSYERCISFS